MTVHACTSVHEDAEIELFAERFADSVAIVFGDAVVAEQVTIDFYDPGMLDRLADLARQGAESLRAKLAVFAADDLSDVDDDRPVEPGAS